MGRNNENKKLRWPPGQGRPLQATSGPSGQSQPPKCTTGAAATLDLVGVGSSGGSGGSGPPDDQGQDEEDDEVGLYYPYNDNMHPKLLD